MYEVTEKSLLNSGAWVGAIISSADKIVSQDSRSWFSKFLYNELKTEGAVRDGTISGEGSFLGATTAGTLYGGLLFGEAAIKNKMSWKWKDKDGNWNHDFFGFVTEAKATGAVAKGKAEGNWGYLHGSAEGAFLTGAATASATITLWDDGKFRPSAYIGGKAEGSVLQGELEGGFGDDQFGVFAKGEGDVLRAEAEVKAGVGYMGEDKNGNDIYGAGVKGSAMASLAQGKVKGGFSLFGIDFDLGVKGYAGAVGVEGSAYISTDGVTASMGGAAVFGGTLEFSVDWSDAKWISDAVDAVGDFLDDTGTFIYEGFSEGVSYISDGVSNITDGIRDFIGWW